MKSAKSLRRILTTVLAALLILAPCAAAQRRRPRTPQRRTPAPVAPRAKPPAARSRTTTPAPRDAAPEEKEDFESDVAFEEVVPAEGFALYMEFRSIGRLVLSKEMNELLGLARLVGGGVKELTESIDFYTSNAEQLDGVNAYSLAMPTRAGLPQFIGAYQFPSAEAAKVFEPKLRGLMKKYEGLLKSPQPATGDAQPPPPPTGARKRGVRRSAPQPPARSLVVKRYGRLILTTDEPFTLKGLKGESEQTLSGNARLQSIRGRFSSEPVFLYLDIGLIEKSTAVGRDLMAQREGEMESGGENSMAPPMATVVPEVASDDEAMIREAQAALARAAEEEAKAAQESVSIEVDPVLIPPVAEVEEASTPPAPVVSGSAGGVSGIVAEGQMDDKMAAGREAEVATRGGEFFMSMIFGNMMGGMPQWPEAIGAALALDGDAVVVRAVVVNPAGAQVQPIPLFPSLIAGPLLTPQASTVAPADTEVFVSASLDFTQIYNRLIASADESRRQMEGVQRKVGAAEPDEEKGVEADIAAAEKLLGFKVREDLLPAMGNEFAVSVSLKWFGGGSGYNHGRKSADAEGGKDEGEGRAPVIFVSLNNADAMKKMLPRVLELTGFKALGTQEQTVNHAGVDIHLYGGLAVAYVGNFLVISLDAASVRRVVDVNSSQGALASDERYRASTSWQPRQKLAEIYVSRALTENLLGEITRWTDPKDAEVQQILARLNINPSAAAYAATNEGGGHLLHELRVPTSIIKYFAAEYALERKITPLRQGEMAVLSTLSYIRGEQDGRKSSKEKAGFATLEELSGKPKRESLGGMGEVGDYNPLSEQSLEKLGYHIELAAAGEKYTVTATPKEYGKTGRRSFYMDETGIIRAADHGGEPATANDPPVD